MSEFFSNPIVWVVLGVILLVILIYNNLNSKKQRVNKSFAAIDTYLSKRADNITVLLDTANNAADRESDMYKEVSALRSGLQNYNNANINDKVKLDNQMRKFMATAESYPQFQSIDIFKTAATEFVKDNRELNAARRQYNSNATSYNIQITSFPTSIIAGIFGFKEKFELFIFDEAERAKLSDVSNLTTGALNNVKKRYEDKNDDEKNEQ